MANKPADMDQTAPRPAAKPNPRQTTRPASEATTRARVPRPEQLGRRLNIASTATPNTKPGAARISPLARAMSTPYAQPSPRSAVGLRIPGASSAAALSAASSAIAVAIPANPGQIRHLRNQRDLVDHARELRHSVRVRLIGDRRSWLLSACLVAVLAALVGTGIQVLAGVRGQTPGDAGRQALAYGQPASTADTQQTAAPTSAPQVSTPTQPASTPNPYIGSYFNTVGQPCHSTTFFVQGIGPWATPPGCYATIYTPNPANYPGVGSTFGYCNWWVEALHFGHRDILDNPAYRRGSAPVPGAAIFFDGNVQGASSAGHWAQVVAIAPDHYWMLITEMNFSWRGGGFGKVDYRYAHTGSGVTFIYS